MKSLIAKTIAPIVAALIGTAALASDITDYGMAEGWKIYVDNRSGKCNMQSPSTGGNMLRAGITQNNDEMGYLAVLTKNPVYFENGQRGKVTLDIDGSAFESEALGVTEGMAEGWSMGVILANTPIFVADFRKGQKMTVNPGTDREFTIGLKGSNAALDKLLECAAAQ